MFFCKPPSWVGQPCSLTLTSMVFNPFYSPAGKEIALTSLISDFLPLGGGKRGSFYVDVLNVSRIELHQHHVERRLRLCCGWERRWTTSWSAEQPIRPGAFPGKNLVAYVQQRQDPKPRNVQALWTGKPTLTGKWTNTHYLWCFHLMSECSGTLMGWL